METRKCHYCGQSFEPRSSGSISYETVKDSLLGQAYPVCSNKCKIEHEKYVYPKENQVKTTESVIYKTKYQYRLQIIIAMIIIFCIIILIKYLVYGNIIDAVNKDPFK